MHPFPHICQSQPEIKSMNPEIKATFASKTLWGVVIAALPTILALFGFKIADLSAFTENAGNIVDGLTTLIGSALAIYGRFKATTALVVK